MDAHIISSEDWSTPTTISKGFHYHNTYTIFFGNIIIIALYSLLYAIAYNARTFLFEEQTAEFKIEIQSIKWDVIGHSELRSEGTIKL